MTAGRLDRAVDHPWSPVKLVSYIISLKTMTEPADGRLQFHL